MKQERLEQIRGQNINGYEGVYTQEVLDELILYIDMLREDNEGMLKISEKVVKYNAHLLKTLKEAEQTFAANSGMTDLLIAIKGLAMYGSEENGGAATLFKIYNLAKIAIG